MFYILEAGIGGFSAFAEVFLGYHRIILDIQEE